MTVDKGVDRAAQFGQISGAACPETIPGTPFILNAKTARVNDPVPLSAAPDGQSLPPYSQVVYDVDASGVPVIRNAYGIWIEAVPSSSGPGGNGTGFVDFHIRSCWSAAGSSAPMTLGTIVRLYEPR